MKLSAGKKRLNQAQLKGTADLLLEVAKAILLAIALSILFPKISGRIEIIGLVLGLLVVGATYLLAIIILGKVKNI